jgi:hypothetical protein
MRPLDRRCDEETMKAFAYPTWILAGALMIGGMAVAATPSPDGLVSIKLRGIDHAAARPGADLARYGRIRLEPGRGQLRQELAADADRQQSATAAPGPRAHPRRHGRGGQ